MPLRNWISSVLLLLSGLLSAQPQFNDLIYNNHVYTDNINSVQFHMDGFPLVDPIVDINSSTALALNFDDFEEDVQDYFYTIIHCDMNWQPSQLTPIEYIDGFTEERINDFQFSFKTLVPFTNYQMTFPNRSMRFRVTGNYVLVIYKKYPRPEPVITRRFVVYENKLLVDARLSRTSQVSKMRTHQEIDFTVILDPKFRLQNARQSIRATILQNGRWDKMITNVEPLFIRPNELVFDYQDKIVFQGGKEFRFVDLRSLRLRSFNIREILRRVDGHDVYLNTDVPRNQTTYLQITDANGKFTIENRDQGDDFLSADYADVFFTYKLDQPLVDKDIYVVGAFNDWEKNSYNRMVWNEKIGVYVAKIPLKQGYYNYYYVITDYAQSEEIEDLSLTEGNWFATENDYTILIYYRPFGARFDQIIGQINLSSME